MGDRTVSSSPRHGIPRDRDADRKANEHYKNRGNERYGQQWLGKDENEHNLGWQKLYSPHIDLPYLDDPADFY